MIDAAQVWLAVFGAIAVWMSQSPRVELQRWACIAGLLGQPAWLYATWIAEQWGMFALSIVFTAGWCRGLITHWYRKG